MPGAGFQHNKAGPAHPARGLAGDVAVALREIIARRPNERRVAQ